MKIGIISDIHSNYEAINSVLKNMKEADKFLCLGDIVGYGADPNCCIEKIIDLNCKCIGGNHDFTVAGKIDINYFNFIAGVGKFWASLQLKNNNQIDYINLSNGGSIEIIKNKRYIINCGSVGQPRDGNPQASYGIYDLKYNAVNIYRVSYPVNLTQDKIINAGIPRSLADRL